MKYNPAYAHLFSPAPNFVPRGRILHGTADSKGRKLKNSNNDGVTVWNDLQIEQWADDDKMRDTRVQNDQFWDQMNYNVDEYVLMEGNKNNYQATP